MKNKRNLSIKSFGFYTKENEGPKFWALIPCKAEMICSR